MWSINGVTFEAIIKTLIEFITVNYINYRQMIHSIRHVSVVRTLMT